MQFHVPTQLSRLQLFLNHEQNHNLLFVDHSHHLCVLAGEQDMVWRRKIVFKKKGIGHLLEKSKYLAALGQRPE
jgi:hypothetical protein